MTLTPLIICFTIPFSYVNILAYVLSLLWAKACLEIILDLALDDNFSFSNINKVIAKKVEDKYKL